MRGLGFRGLDFKDLETFWDITVYAYFAGFQ